MGHAIGSRLAVTKGGDVGIYDRFSVDDHGNF